MIVISSIINCFFGFLGKFKNQISGLFLFCIGRRLGKEEEKNKELERELKEMKTRDDKRQKAKEKLELIKLKAAIAHLATSDELKEKIKSRSATDDTISIKAKPLGKQNRRGG